MIFRPFFWPQGVASVQNPGLRLQGFEHEVKENGVGLMGGVPSTQRRQEREGSQRSPEWGFSRNHAVEILKPRMDTDKHGSEPDFKI